MLKGLSDDLLQRLADHAQSVTFLANDIVIGEGEKGDALYLLTHGHVIVYREQQADNLLAELKDGDFLAKWRCLEIKCVQLQLRLSLLRHYCDCEQGRIGTG